MKTISLYPQNISKILKENISDSNKIFVFATDTVMNSWIDWIITHPQESGTDAVPFERFIAWDTLKRDYINVKQENLTTIPTLLRQFFVNDLIEKNAAKPKENRLQVLINPDDQMAKSATSFVDWICNNIPALHFWKKRLDKHLEEYGELDKEDLDYLYIYNEYSKFLKENNLFEPSWVDEISFKNNSFEFLIFYPEQFQDFSDYQEPFSQNDKITIFTLPKDIPSPKAYLYSDSRKELRTVMLQIIDIVNNKKADWSEIALSIPDIETYRPYIEREFSLYQIPYVIKAGQSLTKNCAGRIFKEIYNCYSTDFSFDSVRALLLDECVPWKEEIREIKEELIREGNRMRCICSPYDKNIWFSALNSKLARVEKQNSTKEEIDYYSQLKDFYSKLYHCINQFFSENYKTFEQIRRSWMEFKQTFLKSDSDFSEEANNILSRCIKELEEIIQIEKDYKNCNLQISNPYNFYLQILDGKTYSPQTNKTGVQIFKYRLSASAYFKYQFVIDSSQNNLDISFKKLTFLNSTKRAKLHLLEDDKLLNSTEVYIKLYAKPTDCADADFVHFSSAEQTFAGYSIPHTLLSSTKECPNLDDKDYILAESKVITTHTNQTLNQITESQKQAFLEWKTTNYPAEQKVQISERIKELLQKKIDSQNNNLNISARQDMENYFPCPRKWLFKSVLKFHDDTLDTNLMQSFDMGNLNHKILEEFMKAFKNKELPCYIEETETFMIKTEDVTEQVNALLTSIIDSAIFEIKDFRDSPLVIQTLLDQKQQIFATIHAFLCSFLLPFYGKGFGSCKVLDTEASYSLAKEKFNYIGRIDCLLQTPEFDLIVIDYKNTKSAIPSKKDFRVDDNGILKDFQMPLYYKLVSEITGNDIHAMYYVAISGTDKSAVFDLNDTKAPFEGYENTLLRLDEYAQSLTDSFYNKNFEPHKSNNEKDIFNVKNYEHCKDCIFKTICRTTYTIAGREISNNE